VTAARVAIYDTTLRDGTQAEGISLSLADKLAIAHRLDELGFDYVEGGWPGSNPKDEAFFAAMAEQPLAQARLVAFGSTRRRDTKAEDDPQLRLLVDARTPVVALVAKSSDFHVRVVLKTSLEENLAMIGDSVRFLKEEGREVVLDAEHFFDGYRASPDYALDALRAAADAGADWLVLCDTNGGSLPGFVGEAVARVRDELGVVVGIHTHNDGELAVANSLAGIEAGATQVQGTINGYGERTGNANLCSIVPNLALKLGREVGVDVGRLTELSRFVDEVAHVPPNKRLPYVGEDAFAHKGGVHVHAVAADPATYEHVEPASVGNERHVLISELSGRNNVLERAKALGLELDGEVATMVVARVKELENEGFRFEDAEASFELLAHRARLGYQAPFEPLYYNLRTREDASGSHATATVGLRSQGRLVEASAEGGGPVNALENALRAALADAYPPLSGFALTGFRAEVLEGRAGGRGPVRVWTRGTAVGCGSWATVGSSTGLLDAAWLALVDAAEYAIARACPVPVADEEKEAIA
jgi:2-isopropylmalate synthase